MTILQISRKGSIMRRSPLFDALEDFIGGLKRWELWITLGWHDINQRYRRSVVGPFWITISTGAMVAGIAYLYSGILGISIEEFLPYLAVGTIVFNWITSIATDGSTAFVGASRTILQTKAPLSIYVYQMLWRNLLILAHNMSIYLILLVFLNIQIGWVTFLVVPGLFLVTLIGFWTGIILGTLGARFRDIPPIVSSIMQVAFFLTPIFWTTAALKGREVFVHFNPFYYLLEVIRMPLLGQAPSSTMWLVVIAMSGASGIVGFVFFARYRARVAYWV